MNNLQYLYLINDDFQRFITNHLVVFEHWYKNELGEISIDSDIEAHEWLMAERYDSGSDYNDYKLPDPCLRLDFGGGEYKSIELGEGTGYIRADLAYGIFGEFKFKMDCLVCELSNGMISKSGVDNAIIKSVIDEAYQEDFEEELARASNDYDTLKLYAGKVRDLLVQVYGLANYVWKRKTLTFIPVEWAQRMNEIYQQMEELGIEVGQ